ncbi:MAG: VOC family protein [Propioniciclava sp.]|uniref:VOC family protein n=1 Tax=Propioniciclava sp. TaxID=2038686 RepID=UPI0039E5BAF7
MRLSNLTFAAGPDGLTPAVRRLEDSLGVPFRDGGFHPSFGTRNNILPLADGRYIEAVEVLEHPAAEKAIFGQAVRARSALGGGWLAWVIQVDDMAPLEERLGRKSAHGTRQFPDGRRLEWDQIGVKGLMADPQLPFFVKWTSPDELLPSALPPREVEVLEIRISGSRDRVSEWVGRDIGPVFDGVGLNFDSPNGNPGIESVTFRCPKGIVTV